MIPEDRNDLSTARLQAVLEVVDPAEFAVAPVPHASGLDNVVFRATSQQFGEVALKVPWHRWISNDNDPAQDARVLLEQELRLSRFVCAAGLPGPQVHDLICDERLDILVSSFVPADPTPTTPVEIGRLAARLHATKPPDVSLVAQEDSPIERLLARRMSERIQAVERLSDAHFGLPDAARIAELLQPYCGKRCLLHMDLRPENVLTLDGRVVALIDWANALIGPPELELARAHEYLNGTPGFFAGYGKAKPFSDVSRAARLLFAIDTAVMLAIVGLSEAPDPDFAARKIERLRALCEELHALT